LAQTSPAFRQQLNRIGERIASIRLSRNLTQAQLGDKAGSSRNTIRRLEAGETVSLDTFIRVLDALDIGVSLETLLPDPSVRPVDRVRLRGAERQRARPGEDKPQKASDWAWGAEGDA
jgi:transcriptional regulator with XRE-family HTH domain